MGPAYNHACTPSAPVGDRAGRIVVPKAIREAANLRSGTEVQFRVQGGHVEIEPVPLTVTLQRRGSLVVAVPQANQPVMRAAEVDKHEHHDRTRVEIECRKRSNEELVVAAHSLAETYAVFMRLPAPHRFRSADAIALNVHSGEMGRRRAVAPGYRRRRLSGTAVGVPPGVWRPVSATRGLSIRAEVIRLIEQELAMVDDIEAALRAVLGPAPKRRRRPPAP